MSGLNKTVHAQAAVGRGTITRPAAKKTGGVVTRAQPAQGKSAATAATATRS